MAKNKTLIDSKLEPKPPSQHTLDANADSVEGLDFQDPADSTQASMNALLTRNPIQVPSGSDPSKLVWDMAPYAYQANTVTAPNTINPSLWRQARLNQINGLFKVLDGIYQVRAFDMSNMTIIEAPEGLIIIDPLISMECASAAFELYKEWKTQHDKKEVPPLRAIIFTHSHVDHFGGVLGVVKPEALATASDPEQAWTDGKVRVIAPAGFLEHAVSENVYAGTAMSRRAQYMYGPYLEQRPEGQVDGGLGKGQSTGRVSIAAPRISISQDCTLTIAGTQVDFHMTPGAEAPAEFDFYFHQWKAFCASENACHTMHNIQTLRGAKVRDSLQWSKYLNETLHRYGAITEVLFASHHWPIWDTLDSDKGRVARFLTRQRDMYRYLNDQTLRMLNKGYTGIEIAEVFEMPPALKSEWTCRGYYGTVNHNVKAVYDRYMGWFDGNPSNLHPLPPHQSAPLYVAAMGGAPAVLELAKKAADEGQYRWAAELLHKAVFTHPQDTDARHLLADVLEQLGYQAEAATWRNFYLMGAYELRYAPPEAEMSSADPAMTAQMTVEMIFDSIAATINGPQANLDPKPLIVNWLFRDTDQGDYTQKYLMELSNGALSTIADFQDAQAGVTVKLSRTALNELIGGQATFGQLVEAGRVTVTGDAAEQARLAHLFSLVDSGVLNFPIVTPRSDATVAWQGEGSKARQHKAEGHAGFKRKLQVLGKMPRGC